MTITTRTAHAIAAAYVTTAALYAVALPPLGTLGYGAVPALLIAAWVTHRAASRAEGGRLDDADEGRVGLTALAALGIAAMAPLV